MVKAMLPVGGPDLIVWLAYQTSDHIVQNRHTFNPVPLAKASSVSLTCMTRSRVGRTMRARSLVTALEERIWIKGIAYANVLPDPVGADIR
jgi:hypothetical protein